MQSYLGAKRKKGRVRALMTGVSALLWFSCKAAPEPSIDQVSNLEPTSAISATLSRTFVRALVTGTETVSDMWIQVNTSGARYPMHRISEKMFEFNLLALPELKRAKGSEAEDFGITVIAEGSDGTVMSTDTLQLPPRLVH